MIWNIFFGEGSTFQPIHLDELQCLGSEDTLLNCTHSGIGDHDCTHSEDVGIICQRSLGRVMHVIWPCFVLALAS